MEYKEKGAITKNLPTGNTLIEILKLFGHSSSIVYGIVQNYAFSDRSKHKTTRKGQLCNLLRELKNKNILEERDTKEIYYGMLRTVMKAWIEVVTSAERVSS